MKFTVVTTVLLGLLLTPALAEELQYKDGNQQILNRPFIRRQFTIAGGYQFLTLNREFRVATIEGQSPFGLWKTVWNYNTGFVATKLLPERACFISVMNRRVMPRFDVLPTLVEESRLLKGQGLPTEQLTFIIQTPVNDFQSYGPEISTMCRGVPTYLAYEVYGPQYTYNLGSCVRLDVLRLLKLSYCRANANGNPNVIPIIKV